MAKRRLRKVRIPPHWLKYLRRRNPEARPEEFGGAYVITPDDQVHLVNNHFEYVAKHFSQWKTKAGTPDTDRAIYEGKLVLAVFVPSRKAPFVGVRAHSRQRAKIAARILGKRPEFLEVSTNLNLMLGFDIHKGPGSPVSELYEVPEAHTLLFGKKLTDLPAGESITSTYHKQYWIPPPGSPLAKYGQFRVRGNPQFAVLSARGKLVAEGHVVAPRGTTARELQAKIEKKLRRPVAAIVHGSNREALVEAFGIRPSPKKWYIVLKGKKR